MQLTTLGQAVVMFAITNIDDMLVLAVFFSRARGEQSKAVPVVVGQYLGFIAILAVSVLGALGADLLPESVIPYLGLLPLILGVRAAWRVWQQRRTDDPNDEPSGGSDNVQLGKVAMVTLANGGDNISVYVPVFSVAGIGGMVGYVVVFLLGVAVWCAAGWYFASRLAVTTISARWGHVLLPITLITIGLTILINGNALGL